MRLAKVDDRVQFQVLYSIALGSRHQQVYWTINNFAYYIQRTKRNWHGILSCHFFYWNEIKVKFHECHGVSNNRRIYSLFNSLFTRTTQRECSHSRSLFKGTTGQFSSQTGSYVHATRTSCTPFKCFQLAWWRLQIESFSVLLALCEGNPLITGGFPHKGQWRGALMFSLICAWTKGEANSRELSRWFKTSSRSLWRRCRGKRLTELSTAVGIAIIRVQRNPFRSTG